MSDAEIKKLQAEHLALQAKYDILHADMKEVAIMIASTFDALGIWPIPEEGLMKKVVKAVPSIISMSVLDPKELTRKFSKITEGKPLLEKYQYLIPDKL